MVTITEKLIKGNSTTDCPNQPKHKVTQRNNTKFKKCKGLNIPERILDVSKNGSAKKIKIATPIVITPPNLSGIVLKIA